MKVLSIELSTPNVSGIISLALDLVMLSVMALLLSKVTNADAFLISAAAGSLASAYGVSIPKQGFRAAVLIAVFAVILAAICGVMRSWLGL